MIENKFKWEIGNFDGRGLAVVIAKSECPDLLKLPEYFVKNIPDVLASCKVAQPESKWLTQYRDGENVECVLRDSRPINRKTKKPKLGWFPVWVIKAEVE